jgi:predicted DNA-binding ribbon-helix-helix protein
MPSMIKKRSIVIGGHKTSVSMEEDFWEGFREIARLRGQEPGVCAKEIDLARKHTNLSSAIRLAVLRHYRGK